MASIDPRHDVTFFHYMREVTDADAECGRRRKHHSHPSAIRHRHQKAPIATRSGPSVLRAVNVERAVRYREPMRPTTPEVTTSSPSSPSALLITGTVGAGRTSVAEVVGDRLAEAEISNAVIDLDWLRRTWPSPPGDPFNVAMTVRNLRSVAGNYLGSGTERLVLAGVVETAAQRERFREALNVPMVVCRLLVELPVIHARLACRHTKEETALRWHLSRAGELDATWMPHGSRTSASTQARHPCPTWRPRSFEGPVGRHCAQQGPDSTSRIWALASSAGHLELCVVSSWALQGHPVRFKRPRRLCEPSSESRATSRSTAVRPDREGRGSERPERPG